MILSYLHCIHLLQVVGILGLYLLLPTRYLPLFTSNVGSKATHFGVLLSDLQLIVVFNIILLVLDIAAASGNHALGVVVLLWNGLETASGAVLLVSSVTHLTRDSNEVSVPARRAVLVLIHVQFLALIQVV